MTVGHRMRILLYRHGAERGARHRTLVAGAALLFSGLLIAGLIVGIAGSQRPIERNLHSTAPPAAGTVAGRGSAGPAPPTAVPPVTVVPAQTPVQQQYDQALASGLSASPTVLAAESASVPPPAVSSAWPALPPSNSAQKWIHAFITELLSIHFDRQTRSGLASWLSDVEAPELLPGVPPAAENKVLYLSLMDPSAAGSGVSPIPDQSQWSNLSAKHVSWSAHDLLIQPDVRWSQILAAGWQPTDERFGAFDVSGLLAQTGGSTSTSAHFSLVIYVGSAHWQHGYGTVLVSNWEES